VYRTFEDFEREELRRPGTGLSSSIEDMLDEMFAEELELDFEPGAKRRRKGATDEEE
jgi:hypothetical protein